MTTDQAGSVPVVGDRRWKALAVCLTAAFMTLLDTSIVNVALPSVERGLHADEAELSWVMSGYALAYGLCLVPAGRLGDMRGRRQTFLTGLALFTLASAACGLSSGAAWLVLFRLLQGASAALIAPQTAALIQQMFQGPERARAFGMMGSTIGISTAVGPLAGGLLIQASGGPEGWRWVFYVNLPIGVAVFCAALRLLPRSPGSPGRRGEGFDLLGVLLLGAGVLALMLPLVQNQQWHERSKWALLPAGACLLAAFWVWERHQGRRGRAPLIDLGLFRLRSFTLGALLSLVYFGGFTTLFFVYTLFLQNSMGYGALAAGLSSMPFALGAAVGAALGEPAGAAVRAPNGHRRSDHGGGGDGRRRHGRAVRTGAGGGLGSRSAAARRRARLGPDHLPEHHPHPLPRPGGAGRGRGRGPPDRSAHRLGRRSIAVVGSVYFARLAHRGSPATALQLGLLTSVGIILLALVLAYADLRERRSHPEEEREPEAARQGA
ncbi:MFS transporter [Streptomyces lasalocidi]